MKFVYPKTQLFYLLLLFSGIGLYIVWGAAFGVWMDLGLYSICIVMVLLGLFGTILYSKEREEFQQEDAE